MSGWFAWAGEPRFARLAWAALAGALLALPEPARACTPPLSVYFGYGSAELSDYWRKVLDGFVTQFRARQQDLVGIEVVGHSDRTGTPASRRAIAAQRAVAVRDFLVTMGFSARLLKTRAAGDAEPEVPTADGVREPNNRRASLVVTFTQAFMDEQAERRRAAMAGGMPMPLC